MPPGWTVLDCSELDWVMPFNPAVFYFLVGVLSFSKDLVTAMYLSGNGFLVDIGYCHLMAENLSHANGRNIVG